MVDLGRILNLIKKTKDKFIISDSSLGDFVVCSLADYEKMIGLSQKNTEIERKGQVQKTDEDGFHDSDEFGPILDEKVGDDHYYFEPVDEEE